MSRSGAARPGLSAVLVTAYLLLVGAWLVATRRIPPPGLLRVLRARLRRPHAGPLEQIRHAEGACYVAPLPSHLLSDLDSVSALEVLEERRPLGPAHASHAEIRAAGGGRFSHWGAELYFSSSDGSDPRSNGRRYEVREVRGPREDRR